jgi:hypothetical protein
VSFSSQSRGSEESESRAQEGRGERESVLLEDRENVTSQTLSVPSAVDKWQEDRQLLLCSHGIKHTSVAILFPHFSPLSSLQCVLSYALLDSNGPLSLSDLQKEETQMKSAEAVEHTVPQ